jgi:hypothetical protein
VNELGVKYMPSAILWSFLWLLYAAKINELPGLPVKRKAQSCNARSEFLAALDQGRYP